LVYTSISVHNKSAATLMKSRAARVAIVKMFVEKEKAQTIKMIRAQKEC